MSDGVWDLSELVPMVESECWACDWEGFSESEDCPGCGKPLYIKGDGKIKWGDKKSVTVYRPFKNRAEADGYKKGV